MSLLCSRPFLGQDPALIWGLALPRWSWVPGPVLGTINTHALLQRTGYRGTGNRDSSETGRLQAPTGRESGADREDSLQRTAWASESFVCVCVGGGHLTPSSLFSHGGSTCRSNSKVDWGRHSSTEKGHASSHRGRKAGQRLVNPFYRFCTVDLFPCVASSFFPTFQSP